MAYGNGMRPDVWMPFKERFNVKIINEFYASTEGNTFISNFNSGFSRFGAGAVGRESALGRMVTGDYLVKVDPEEQEIYRNSKGWCEEAGYDEAGELVIRIDDFHPAKQFQGYKGNKEKTDEKILKDVFRKGDSYFRTGDLLRRDRHGFFCESFEARNSGAFTECRCLTPDFEDRLGEFVIPARSRRFWTDSNVLSARSAGAERSEPTGSAMNKQTRTLTRNAHSVSTSEVTECFANFGNLEGPAVYGVQIPKHDGRCGCAAIEKAQFDGIDTKKLVKHLKEKLPKYAVPIFLRVVEQQEKTSKCLP